MGNWYMPNHSLFVHVCMHMSACYTHTAIYIYICECVYIYMYEYTSKTWVWTCIYYHILICIIIKHSYIMKRNIFRMLYIYIHMKTVVPGFKTWLQTPWPSFRDGMQPRFIPWSDIHVGVSSKSSKGGTKWMVYKVYKWMMYPGSPISGHPHVEMIWL